MNILQLSVAALLIFCVNGCGPKPKNETFIRNIPSVTSVEDAIKMFGEPDSNMVQADGLHRYSWVIYKEHVTPAKEVTVYKRPLWGFGSFLPDYDIVRIPEKIARAYCFYTILTDENDAITKVSWEGNACDLLFQRNLYKQHQRKMNSLPDNPISIPETGN